MRWDHPERGWLTPGDFLEAAEDTGLIVPMGYQVLERTARQLADWRERYPEWSGSGVSVNLSSGQLTRADLTDRIQRVLADAGLPATALELEITESEMMTAVAKGSGVMDRLKELGLRIAVDDFGTGYSSLAYLHEFPVDTLKVDRSFVQCIDCDDGRGQIVEAVIRLAESLGLETVGEGVETRGQEKVLRDLGCRMGQGYLYARPLPPGDVEAMFRGAGSAGRV